MSWSRRLLNSRPLQMTVGIVAAEYLRLVWNTSSFRTEPEDIYEQAAPDIPVILAMWHGQLFLGPFVKPPELPSNVLISRHRDGEVKAIAAEWLGVQTIRGSGSLSGSFV